MKKSILAISVILFVLIIDQALKIWVKTSFCYGEDRALFGNTDWARLNFVENPGMAFGWKFGGEWGKLALSLFRLVAISFLFYYVIQLIKRNVNTGLIICFSLILAGAIGNMIDSAFYGLIFSNSDFHCANGPAKLFPPEGGYGTFLHGKVVDMLYFPLWHNSSHDVVFFQPVFNIADSAITIGVLSILLFQRQYFANLDKKEVVVTGTDANIVTETTETIEENSIIAEAEEVEKNVENESNKNEEDSDSLNKNVS